MSRAIAPPQDTRLVALVATRKGAWLHYSDAKCKTWKADGPHLLGHTIAHLELNPRRPHLVGGRQNRSPQDQCRSEYGRVNWTPLPSVNDSAQLREWMGATQDGTPDGPKWHSILVDPRDAAHLNFAMSGGGLHGSRDAGLCMVVALLLAWWVHGEGITAAKLLAC